MFLWACFSEDIALSAKTEGSCQAAGIPEAGAFTKLHCIPFKRPTQGKSPFTAISCAIVHCAVPGSSAMATVGGIGRTERVRTLNNTVMTSGTRDDNFGSSCRWLLRACCFHPSGMSWLMSDTAMELTAFPPCRV